jgi:hypothetical protein
VNEPATTGGLFESSGYERYPASMDEFISGLRGCSPMSVGHKPTFLERLRESEYSPPSLLELEDVISEFSKLTPKSLEALDKAFEKAVLATARAGVEAGEIADAIKRLNFTRDKLHGELNRATDRESVAKLRANPPKVVPDPDPARQAVIESVTREIDIKMGRRSAPLSHYPTDVKAFAAALR